MSVLEFSPYIAGAIADYASDQVRSGEWLEADSHRHSQENFDSLLPQGISTPDHYFYNLRDTITQETVGRLWFGIQKRAGTRVAYLYDILVIAKYRRRGYATGAFKALEAEAKNLGLSAIVLHVFGHNTAAQALYKKMGFKATNLKMFKNVG
jgi:RimJ/RimL family protein N-acetyltransferase